MQGATRAPTSPLAYKWRQGDPSQLMPTPEPWFTLSETATHIQVAEDTVSGSITKNNLPAHRAGRVWRFKLSQVDAWMQSGGGAASVGGAGADDDSSTGKP